MIYGYARVSTQGQSLELQEEQLLAAGVQKLYSEKYTGTTTKRPAFKKMLRRLKQGDMLVVTKLDRFARNTREALNVIEPLLDKGVIVRVLNIGFIENSSMGRFFIRTLLSLAEMERDMIVTRMKEGKERAKLKPGYHEGRPKRKITKQYRDAYKLMTEQGMTYVKAAEVTGLSKSTLYRIKRQIEKRN